MDEFENKKHKIMIAKNHIMRMPNTKEKAVLISAYLSLLDFYSETIIDHNQRKYEKLLIDDDFLGSYNKLVCKNTAKELDDISNNALDLYRKYCKIINTYKENDYCSRPSFVSHRVDSKKMLRIMEDFFRTLGDDVLNIYLEMINNNNILVGDAGETIGFSVDPFPIDYPCIVVDNLYNYFYFYIAIVHEVGHAYQYYLQRNQKFVSMFDPYSEINSHLFERLFLDYLKKIHEDKYCEKREETDYNYFLNEVSASKILCRLIINNNIKAMDPFSLEYDCYIPNEMLVDEVERDCGYVMFFNKNIEFVRFHYSIGKAMAMYFHEKLKNNFDQEWKNYKDFLCTVNYLPMNEVLDKYFDVDLVTENIKRITKSYHGR